MTLTEALEPFHSFFMVTSFILGCVVGSFCNVCISRWPTGDSVVSPRSRCPKCMNAIAWYDNIPLISWLILRAKCRHCALPISWIYPLVELITGALFLAVYWRFGLVVATPVYMVLAAGLVIVVFQDLADWTIPNEVTMPGIPIGIGIAVFGMLYEGSMLRIIHPIDAIDGVVLGAFVICLLDAVVVLLLRKPGMGFGDVKLLAFLGAFLGWRGVIGVLMMASLLGSLIGVGMILYFRLREGKGDETEEEEEGEGLPEPPIDPLANILLLVCSAYLFTRIALFFPDNPSAMLAAARPIITYGGFFVAILSTCVAGASLKIYYSRPPGNAVHVSGETDARDAAEEDEDITLSNHYLPFGPYLAGAGLLFLFFGQELVDIYMASLS